MNRLYALLWIVALATTVLAQNWAETPNMRLRQLEESLQEQGYKINSVQSNTDGISITRSWSMAMPVQGMPNTFKPMPDSIIAQRQERQAKALGTIRLFFTDLSKEATESQMYENHQDGTDTVEYVLNWVSPQASYGPTSHPFQQIRRYGAFVTADFFYRKNEDGCDECIYSHLHKEPLGVAYEEMKPFDVAAFEAQVRPALAPAMTLQGAYSCPIYWRHDAGFKDDFDGGIQTKFNPESKSGAGLATGTRYFIPARYQDEANRLMRQLQSLTYDYVNRHRDQYYRFHDGSDIPYPDENDESKWLVNNTFNGVMLMGGGYQGFKDYTVYYQRRNDGLHILFFSSEGSAWMPKEWYRIKSYINGKLVYLKDAEKDGKRQAVANAIADRQWRIDINSMSTMRYGSRTVAPDFYLELRGDTLRSYLPYLGQVRVPSMQSPSIGLNFEAPVLNYKQSSPKSKYTQIDIDVKLSEDTYHYIIEIDDSGEATIRVRPLNRDPISFNGTM
jgi:hypothetical protein